MHEMALTQSVVDAVCEHAAGRHVQSVKVEIGALCAVVPDAMQFCFELATEGTIADGARLDLDPPLPERGGAARVPRGGRSRGPGDPGGAGPAGPRVRAGRPRGLSSQAPVPV